MECAALQVTYTLRRIPLILTLRGVGGGQVEDIRDACEMRHFYQNKLGISDRSVATTTWPEVLQRIVLLQQHIRLCVVRDLSAHDICARIMRKDNFLIGMINKVNPIAGYH